MKCRLFIPAVTLGLVLLISGCVVPGPPGLPPPPPLVVEAPIGVAPYPDAVWVGGNWHWHAEHNRYEWHHGGWDHRH